MLKIYKKSLFIFLIGIMNCSANDNIQNNNQTNQTLANIDNQLVNLEAQKAQIHQQYTICLASAQAAPQMPYYYFGGDDIDITLAEGNVLLRQTAQMTTCGHTANYQLNQIEYASSSLLYQRSMLERQSRANSQPPATINNPTLPTPVFPPASTSAPASEADKMQSFYYKQLADEARQREKVLIKEQGDFNLKKDCNNRGGIWGGRNIGCY